MDILNLKNNIFEDPPSVYFSLADPFVQKYYKLDKTTIEKYLKLSLLLGKSVDITAANIWQSNISMQIFQSSKELNKLGLIKLAVRKNNQGENAFSTYFKQRLDESSHYIALPGILSFLDYQLPETIKIARELDVTAEANERKGGNVTDIYSEKVILYFGGLNDEYILENLLRYKEEGLISRSTIADVILGQPYNDSKKHSLIIKSNHLLLLSNAEVNHSQLIYPINQYEVAFERPNYNQKEIIMLLNNIGITFELLDSISYNSFYIASKNNVLKKLQQYIWFLRMNKHRHYLLIRFVVYLARREFEKLLIINKNYKYIENNLNQNKIYLSLDSDKIFRDNLNRSIIFMSSEEIMEKNEIQVPVLMQEFTEKLSLEELKNLTVDLFGDYETLSHDNKLSFVRELCLKAKRLGKLPETLKKAMKINPSINVLAHDIDIHLSDLNWKGDSQDDVGDAISSENLEKIIYDYSRFQSIGFLEKGFIISKRICMLHSNSFSATAFWINKFYILTNKHVLNSIDKAKGVEVWLNYENTSRSTDVEKYVLDEKSLIISSKYDLAICKVIYSESEYLSDFPLIECGEFKKNDIVPIIQHPNGFEKQLCIGHNSLKYFDEDCIQYLTDTLPGSSGAPVFNSRWQLIGLHRRGGNIAEPRSGGYNLRNEGIPINRIQEFLRENRITLF